MSLPVVRNNPMIGPVLESAGHRAMCCCKTLIRLLAIVRLVEILGEPASWETDGCSSRWDKTQGSPDSRPAYCRQTGSGTSFRDCSIPSATFAIVFSLWTSTRRLDPNRTGILYIDCRRKPVTPISAVASKWEASVAVSAQRAQA